MRYSRFTILFSSTAVVQLTDLLVYKNNPKSTKQNNTRRICYFFFFCKKSAVFYAYSHSVQFRIMYQYTYRWRASTQASSSTYVLYTCKQTEQQHRTHRHKRIYTQMKCARRGVRSLAQSFDWYASRFLTLCRSLSLFPSLAYKLFNRLSACVRTTHVSVSVCACVFSISKWVSICMFCCKEIHWNIWRMNERTNERTDRPTDRTNKWTNDAIPKKQNQNKI